MQATREDHCLLSHSATARPDPAGLDTHVGSGLPLEAIIAGFIKSPEFRAKYEDIKVRRVFDCEFLVPLMEPMYDSGEYEPHVFRPLMDLIQPGVTFLDIGANIGVFSVHAAARRAQVIAIEAWQQPATIYRTGADHRR